MKQMTLQNITAACHGTYYGSQTLLSKEIGGIAIDSRKVEQNFLFVPLKGARVDGHKFIPQVMENGALATLSEERLENVPYPYILVQSCEQALADLSAFYRSTLDLKVVGITGSVGKTSTKETIASVLSQKYKVLKTEGNHNNEIGVPLTVFSITEEHEVAVLEMGIDHPGDMHKLGPITRPDIAVITNIGLAHLENFGTREGTLKAKTEIFEYLNPNATVILNGDDDKLSTVSTVQGRAPVFFGLSDTLPAYADEIKDLGLLGTDCTLHLPAGEIRVHIPVPGKHMIYNALAGACTGLALGLSLEEIKAGLAALRTISGRTNLIQTDSLLIIDDCYNANPISTMSSLDILSTAKGRTVAVLGDMFELGANEKELHYNTGAHASQDKIDIICCIGELSKNTYSGAKAYENGNNILYFETKQEFLDKLPNVVKKGDTILVKASHSMEFPEIVESLQQLKLS